jgi:hypothetical protein
MDELDQAVQAMLTGAEENADPRIAPLLEIALGLRDLPREEFQAFLKSDLEREISMATTQALPAAGVRQSATARLRIKNTAAAIKFYEKAFGAREIMRFEVGGEIAYAEIAIGNSVIMLGEASPEHG